MCASEQLERRRVSLESRKRSLEQAARLHPLSAACLQLADTLMSEVVDETVQAYARAHMSEPKPLPAASQALLEGWSTQQVSEAAASAPLRDILELEAETTAKRSKTNASTPSPSEDVFGNRPKQASDTIICNNCFTQVSANRYAPHLERCMLGKGRASARAARDSMRANAPKEQ